MQRELQEGRQLDELRRTLTGRGQEPAAQAVAAADGR